MADLKGLIETVARALADQPDVVSVRESERRGSTVYELQVASSDLGRVIGRQGRTAAALRTLLSSAAEADDRRVSLDIRDRRDEADGAVEREARSRERWDDAILVGVVARTHGNRGEVIVNAETDFPEDRFQDGARLGRARKDGSPATLEVAAMRMHQGRPVVRFKGSIRLTTPSRSRDWSLRVAEDERDAAAGRASITTAT